MGRSNVTQKPLAQARDKDIPASWVAVQRAARMAREQAVRTNTAIVVIRDNKLMRITADELRSQGVK
jgi:hypothetical protein